jgi:hypothetical protein
MLTREQDQMAMDMACYYESVAAAEVGEPDANGDRDVLLTGYEGRVAQVIHVRPDGTVVRERTVPVMATR